MCVTVFSLSFHRGVCVCVCVCVFVCGKSHRWHRPHGSVMVLGDEKAMPSSPFNLEN